MPAASLPAAATRAQRTAFAELKARPEFVAATRIYDSGMGEITIDWIDDQGREYGTSFAPNGRRSYEREIWC